MPDTAPAAAPETAASASPAATPQAPAPQSAIPTASASPSPSSGTPQAPATGAPSDDRSGWVPRYRIQETREAALREASQQFAQREAEYQARLAQIQTQLHALVGVQPPQNPEVQAVRSQFSQLYPGLADLEERAQDVRALLDRAGDLEAQTTHYWRNYGERTMDRLFEHAQSSLGTPLTDAGRRALHTAFTGFVQSSPELTARYANDPTIVEDFWKDFTSNFIDPARRAASATVVGRATATLPQDTPSGAVRTSTPTTPLKDLDERANAGWAIYQQNKRPGSS